MNDTQLRIAIGASVFLSWAFGFRCGFGRGWRKGWNDAEEIWKPTAKELGQRLRDRSDAIVDAALAKIEGEGK